jgi:hypothetical protein
MLIKFSDGLPPKLIQALKLSALSQDFQPAFEGGDAQCGLSGADAGAAGLQVKQRGARSAASIRCAGNLLEEFGGAPIFSFREGEICLLKNRRDILWQGFSDVAAKQTAHKIFSWTQFYLLARSTR